MAINVNKLAKGI